MSLQHIKDFLDALDQQRDRIFQALDDLLNDERSPTTDPLNQGDRGFRPPVRLGGNFEDKRDYVHCLGESFLEDVRPLFAAALAATVSVPSQLQPRWVESLNRLDAEHRRFLEDTARAATRWVESNAAEAFDVQVAEIELGRSVYDVRLELDALQRKSVRGGTQSRRHGLLKIKGVRILVNGEHVTLNMTTDRAVDARIFLAAVIAANGDWISSKDIDKQEKTKSNGRTGVRWDRVRKSLPPAIRDHIETARAKGFRIRMA